MLDLNHYIHEAISDQKDQALMKKFFRNYNFQSINHALKYFQSIESKLSLDNKDLKEKIVSLSSNLVNTLEQNRVNLFELLEDEIYPNLDKVQLLSELEPKQNATNITLACPSCGKKEAYIGGHGRGGVIICNRNNKCGKSISIFKYVKERDHLSTFETIKKLADASGIDLELYIKRNEYHKDIDSDIDYTKDITIQKSTAKIKKYTEEVDYIEPDFSKEYDKRNLEEIVSQNISKFSSLSKEDQFKTILGYIQVFSINEKKRNKSGDKYLKGRGIEDRFLKDIGVIRKEAIPTLVKELKTLFGKEKLIEFNILNKNGFWKFNTKTKEGNYYKADCVVFGMHDPYSLLPTNLEFKFFNLDKVIPQDETVELKSVSLENNTITYSQYFSLYNTIDYLKVSQQSKGRRRIWSEGIVDGLSIGSLGYASNCFIGVTKHYEQNLKFYKDEIHIIAFDQDNAGWKNSMRFAEKLKKAGATKIFLASWDADIANDLNELFLKEKFDEIKLTQIVFDKDMAVGVDITKISHFPDNRIDMAYNLKNEALNPNKIDLTDQEDIIVKKDISGKETFYLSLKDIRSIVKKVQTETENDNIKSLTKNNENNLKQKIINEEIEISGLDV